MPRSATGELRRLAVRYAARITIGGRKRRAFPLAACLTREQADERKNDLARMALRLRDAGHSDKIAKLIGSGAGARPGRAWQAVVDAVELICSGGATQKAAIPTFGAFAQDWTSGALARRFPDQVRQKRSSNRDEELLRLYVLPHVRDVRVDEFDLSDAELVMASLARRRLWSTGASTLTRTRRTIRATWTCDPTWWRRSDAGRNAPSRMRNRTTTSSPKTASRSTSSTWPSRSATSFAALVSPACSCSRDLRRVNASAPMTFAQRS
jgi:hypothetical protein